LIAAREADGNDDEAASGGGGKKDPFARNDDMPDPGNGTLRFDQRFSCPELRVLTLQHNGLRHISGMFGGFRSLVTLDISYNKL